MQLFRSSVVSVHYLLTLGSFFLIAIIIIIIIIIIIFFFFFFFFLVSPDGIKFPVTGSKWSKRRFNNNAFGVFLNIGNNE